MKIAYMPFVDANSIAYLLTSVETYVTVNSMGLGYKDAPQRGAIFKLIQNKNHEQLQ